VGVLRAVVLERPAGAVGRVTVGLDDDPLVPPEEVDLVALDLHVHLRLREPVAAAKLEEAFFEGRAGEGGARLVGGQHPSEAATAESAVLGRQLGQVEPEVVGFVECSLERSLGEHVRQVDDRSGWGGDGDAFDPGRLGCLQWRTVDDHQSPPCPFSAAWDRDVDPRGFSVGQAPEQRGASVAQDGPFPTRKDSGQEAAVAGQAGMTYRVDASVDAVQPPGANSPVDGGLA
jgi:hypothetical protein